MSNSPTSRVRSENIINEADYNFMNDFVDRVINDSSTSRVRLEDIINEDDYNFMSDFVDRVINESSTSRVHSKNITNEDDYNFMNDFVDRVINDSPTLRIRSENIINEADYNFMNDFVDRVINDSSTLRVRLEDIINEDDYNFMNDFVDRVINESFTSRVHSENIINEDDYNFMNDFVDRVINDSPTLRVHSENIINEADYNFMNDFVDRVINDSPTSRVHSENIINEADYNFMNDFVDRVINGNDESLSSIVSCRNQAQMEVSNNNNTLRSNNQLENVININQLIRESKPSSIRESIDVIQIGVSATKIKELLGGHSMNSDDRSNRNNDNCLLEASNTEEEKMEDNSSETEDSTHLDSRTCKIKINRFMAGISLCSLKYCKFPQLLKENGNEKMLKYLTWERILKTSLNNYESGDEKKYPKPHPYVKEILHRLLSYFDDVLRIRLDLIGKHLSKVKKTTIKKNAFLLSPNRTIHDEFGELKRLYEHILDNIPRVILAISIFIKGRPVQYIYNLNTILTNISDKYKKFRQLRTVFKRFFDEDFTYSYSVLDPDTLIQITRTLIKVERNMSVMRSNDLSRLKLHEFLMLEEDENDDHTLTFCPRVPFYLKTYSDNYYLSVVSTYWFIFNRLSEESSQQTGRENTEEYPSENDKVFIFMEGVANINKQIEKETIRTYSKPFNNFYSLNEEQK
uniref:HECT domain-containing protein n=1 Tax=Parastrongyloides trichosuri TaxID=131310 RepID=A0A0N5A3L0_PARTI